MATDNSNDKGVSYLLNGSTALSNAKLTEEPRFGGEPKIALNKYQNNTSSGANKEPRVSPHLRGSMSKEQLRVKLEGRFEIKVGETEINEHSMPLILLLLDTLEQAEEHVESQKQEIELWKKQVCNGFYLFIYLFAFYLFQSKQHTRCQC